MHAIRGAAAALVAIGFFASTAFADPAADDPLVVHDCSYGDVYQFQPAGCAISIENEGATPLRLSIVSVQPGNSVDPEKLTLAPHARARLSTHIQTDNIAGQATWTFRIENPSLDPHYAKVSGFVMSALDDPRPKIAFEQIDLTRSPTTRSVTLASSVDASLRIAKIISAAEFLHAKIGADGKTLTSTIGAQTAWGPFDEIVKVALDSKLQPQAWIEITGEVDGDVGPAKEPYWVGEIPWQPQRVLRVPLVDRNGRDFKIGNVTSKEFAGTYETADCDPAASGCKELLIHVANAQPAGLFKSHIDIALPDRDKHLMLAIWGVLGEPPQPGETTPRPAVTKVPVTIPKTDTGSTSATMVQPDPPGQGPLLKWTIAHQDSVRGYQIFRGDSPDGPFALMNPDLIPTLENGGGSVAYRWRDTSATKGQTYWYYVAVLYNTGERKPLSAPQKAVAK